MATLTGALSPTGAMRATSVPAERRGAVWTRWSKAGLAAASDLSTASVGIRLVFEVTRRGGTNMSVSVERYENLVGGEWVGAADGATMEVLNPATGETIAKVPSCSAADVDRAVAAAKPWSSGPTQRCRSTRRYGAV